MHRRLPPNKTPAPVKSSLVDITIECVIDDTFKSNPLFQFVLILIILRIEYYLN